MPLKLAIVVLALAAACRGEPHPASTAAAGRICADSSEPRAIAECSGGLARRRAHMLYIRIDSGRELSFANDTAGEAPGGMWYYGRVGRLGFHLTSPFGGEVEPTFSLTNPHTGRSITGLYSWPVLSPDTSRFASFEEGWMGCEETHGTDLEIWRFTDSLPVREFKLRPAECPAVATWGAIDPRWRGNDTLEFTHVERGPPDSLGNIADVKRPVRVIHDAAGWRIVE